MKLVIASDIHGAADACARLMAAIEEESPDRVVLLGDLLYHGPRNDLPADYAPKRVIEMLNAVADRVIAVRGNCEAEVDQMVLKFPCMADHNILLDPAAGMTLFLTHGHVYGPGYHNSVDAWPKLPERSALVYGHTHVKVSEKDEAHGAWVFNPGSVGIPKDGSASYGVYEDGSFEHRLL
ncbi:phosphodiesterase [Olsenella sp. SW781]|uniref:phosphodiesterase n=1 Tax=Olsenella sp. SW781 TaxID=2530046 RepID=UPI001438C8CB|nr:phosphodiesterase [Olsenella sp. SW781]NJE81350.1 phosphodiesterase [Olsenella sp. SW781]